MAKTIQIALVTTLDAKGARELDQWLAKLSQAQTKATPKGGGASVELDKQAVSAARAATAQQNLATAQQRTANAANQAAVSAQRLATEEQRTAVAVQNAATAHARAEVAALRLSQAQDRAATSAQRSATFAQQMGGAFASNLMGIVGPAAAVTAGFSVATSVVNSFVEAFKFKAELDATTASINAQLRGVRDTSVVYAEASAFARQYKLTQEETTSAISASIGVMRSSKAPIEDILGVLARMQVLSPEQSLQEAAVALKALASGDTTSLVTRFEVGRDVATQMKNEIQGGADAVAVMSKFLGDTGIGMDTLAARATGAAGAIKDAAIAAEELKLAQAAFAEGPGLAILQTQISATRGLTRLLSGDFDAMGQSITNAASNSSAVISNLSNDMQGGAGSTNLWAAETAKLTPAIYDEIAAAQQAQAAILAQTQATLDAAYASQADTAAKAGQTAQTDLAAVQALAAADAFMLLHPNISASGVASLVTAGQINPLLAQLVMARIRAAEASAELARFRALAGVQALRAPGSNSVDRTDADDIRANKRDQAVELRNARVKGAQEAAAAEARYQQALGNYSPALDRANADLAQIGKTRGTDSAEYINQLTKITQLEGQAASAAKKGGGGGGGGRAAGGADKAAKAAEATNTRLSDIARQGGNKLTDIEEQTQSKLAAIDAKYAEQRAESQRQLFDEIAQMSAGEAYSQQLNDFEQFGKDLSDEQKALFAAREQSEIRYNERIRQAQEQARQTAAGGDADLAADVLKIREEQAKRQMEIEQAAAKANIDTGGKQQTAIAQQAAEATKANEDAANTDIAIAQAKAAEKGNAQDEEKQAVLDAAETQRQDVIQKAQDTASKVKGASDDQKKAVVDALAAQAQAAKDWADAIVNASNTAQGAMGSVTGPPAAASEEGGVEGGAPAEGGDPGGQGLAGRMSARRTSGASGGGGSMTDAIQTLNDAAAIITLLKPFVAANKGAVKLLNEYKLVVQASVGSLLAIQDLRERLVQPQPVLDLAVVARLKQDVEAVVGMMFNIDASMTSKVRVLTKYLELETASIEILNGVIDLRGKLSQPTPPIDIEYVKQLHQESQAVVAALLGQMMPVNQQQLTLLQRYATAQGQSVQILTDVADLRERLSGDIGGVFDMPQIVQFAKRAAEFVRLIDQQIVPLTEDQAVGFQAYADAAGAAVQILIDVADLRERLSGDIGTPFDPAQIAQFAKRAAEFTRLIQGQLVPLSEEAADSLSRYADAASASIQILIDVADLRQRMSEDIGGPFDMKLVQRLATEAQQVARVIQATLLPTTEEQADAFGRWADTVSSAVSVISDVADLRADTADLAGPIPVAAIQGLATEAKRITQIVQAQLIPTTEETATGFGTYADTVGSAVGIVSDVAGLRADVTDLAGPIPLSAIVGLATEAKRITAIVRGQLVPTSEDQAEGIGRYADSVGAAVGIVSDVAGLRKDAADLAPPLSVAQITRLADDAKRITQIVLARMLPASEEQAEAARRYADTTGAAVSALSDTLGFSGKLFADYVSPSDAQLNMVVADANRIVKRVDAAARVYGTEGLAAAQAFGDATGSVLSAFKDQLLFAQAVGSGDFLVNPANLKAFEVGMGQTLAVASRLGAQASAIPPGNIAALQAAATALSASYDSMIKLAAVPAGNIPQMTGALGGGGGTSVTIMPGAIVINGAGQSGPQIANQVIQQISQRIGSRH